MPNSRQTSVIASPSSNLATNRRRSSITEHSFHGIDTSRPKTESVTHVSGTFCHLCLRPLNFYVALADVDQRRVRAIRRDFLARASAHTRPLGRRYPPSTAISFALAFAVAV